jgi:putative DNA methylase
VEGMAAAGILEARTGKVRLLRREELPGDWDPADGRRLTVWELTRHLIRAVQEKGELAAAGPLVRVGGLGAVARDLVYRLYSLCERKGWAQEALPYNSLVVAWPELQRLAEERRRAMPVQRELE